VSVSRVDIFCSVTVRGNALQDSSCTIRAEGGNIDKFRG
jgi:hypothetical protein